MGTLPRPPAPPGPISLPPTSSLHIPPAPQDADKGCCGSCCLPCAVCCPKCSRCCRPGCSCLKGCLCFVPRLLCSLPRKLLGCHHLKCLLIVVVVVVLLVVVIAGALLMWLHVERGHADAVLRTGTGRAWEEDAATFYVDGGAGNVATVVYDYKNLLVSYRSRLHHACYVTRMDKDNIPGLDAATEAFQRRQAEQRLAMPLDDRSLLGTTASILCSIVPIYWI
ncbi:pulmonary surfactant-associated protein C-like [Oxyura jamaicensis]|uniref:pulmonary surfactant-associated protein C-like n=1 Tax=Oxyura jamaicensis TaxID=8884 RepID=UPI0015A56469|nr:pulmonary surfactant-associated protein C-like [Oxyura jamaicensis]